MRSRNLLRAVRHAGFTLVELMVAITIALFILAAILNVYLNLKNTFNVQASMAQLQDDERLALTMLTTTVETAGYFVNPLTDTKATAFPVQATATRTDGTTYAFPTAGLVVTGTGSGTGTGVASDTLTVRYQTLSGDGLVNCQGGVNTTGTPGVTTALWVNGFSVNANNELQCAVGTGAPVTLAGNVSAFKVMYGVDTDATPDGDVDSYMPASAVTAGNWWGRVYMAQVTLVFQQKNVDGTLRNINVVQNINLMNSK